MTWDCFSDRYSLKFRLNLHKKFRRILSREDLDSAFLEDLDVLVTKKNVLSVACQFYDPAGLDSPIMFPIQALFSEICRDSNCSMISVLAADHATRFRAAVGEILKTKYLTFPRQIFFQNSSQLFIFFAGSLQGYGACIYLQSLNHVNILTSTTKIVGRSALSASQSEISGAILAVRMEMKVKQELVIININMYSWETRRLFLG